MSAMDETNKVGYELHVCMSRVWRASLMASKSVSEEEAAQPETLASVAEFLAKQAWRHVKHHTDTKAVHVFRDQLDPKLEDGVVMATVVCVYFSPVVAATIRAFVKSCDHLPSFVNIWVMQHTDRRALDIRSNPPADSEVASCQGDGKVVPSHARMAIGEFLALVRGECDTPSMSGKKHVCDA